MLQHWHVPNYLDLRIYQILQHSIRKFKHYKLESFFYEYSLEVISFLVKYEISSSILMSILRCAGKFFIKHFDYIVFYPFNKRSCVICKYTLGKSNKDLEIISAFFIGFYYLYRLPQNCPGEQLKWSHLLHATNVAVKDIMLVNAVIHPW